MVQPAEQEKVESTNSSEVEAEQEECNMVTRRTMMIDRFIPSTHPTA